MEQPSSCPSSSSLPDAAAGVVNTVVSETKCTENNSQECNQKTETLPPINTEEKSITEIVMFSEQPKRAVEWMAAMMLTIPEKSGDASSQEYAICSSLLEEVKMASDPFDVIANVKNIKHVTWLLDHVVVWSILKRALKETMMMPTDEYNAHPLNWHKVLDRVLCCKESSETERGSWLNVLLDPSTHYIFKNIVNGNHMLLWTTMVLHYTVIAPHPQLPKHWQKKLMSLDRRPFTRWWVTPQMMSLMAIQCKYVTDETYIDYRTKNKNHFSSNFLDWELLSKHFRHVEEMEEKAVMENIEQEKKNLAAAMEPVQMIVSKSSDTESFTSVENNVVVLESTDMAKCKSTQLSKYLQVGSFLYPFKTKKDGVVKNAIEMNAMLRKNLLNSQTLSVPVKRLGVEEYGRMVCNGQKMYMTVRHLEGLATAVRLNSTELRDALVGCVFSIGQTLVPMKKHGSFFYIELTATEFEDNKPEVPARRVVPETIITFTRDKKSPHYEHISFFNAKEDKKVSEYA